MMSIHILQCHVLGEHCFSRSVCEYYCYYSNTIFMFIHVGIIGVRMERWMQTVPVEYFMDATETHVNSVRIVWRLLKMWGKKNDFQTASMLCECKDFTHQSKELISILFSIPLSRETLWPRGCSHLPLRIQSRSSEAVSHVWLKTTKPGTNNEPLAPFLFVCCCFSEYALFWVWLQVKILMLRIC